MKARHALALCLAIGSPLWLRQQRYERRRDRELKVFAEGLNEQMTAYVESTNKALNRCLDEAEKQLRKALAQSRSQSKSPQRLRNASASEAN